MLLFLTDDRNFGIQTTEALLSRQILTHWAKPDAGRKLFRDKDICAVVLDGRQYFAQIELLCRDLLQVEPQLPLALILPQQTVTSSLACRLIRSEDPEAILLQICSFCKEYGGWNGNISTYSLQMDAETGSTRYLGYELPLSPRERCILRFLFFRAPQLLPSSELLSVCFPQNTQKEANLWVHISNINQTARSIAGFLLIENCYGKGYRLCGGILREKEQLPTDAVSTEETPELPEIS